MGKGARNLAAGATTRRREIARQRVSASAGAPDGTIDMTGRTCRRCGKGTYQEIWQFDDRDGELHCTYCALGVSRYEPEGPAVGVCASCGQSARQPSPPFRGSDLFCDACQSLEATRMPKRTA